MKLKQHREIAITVIGQINPQLLESFHFNKTAYLFGSMAPDLNCVYPAHRLDTTRKRFCIHVKRVDNSIMDLIKSFELGVITHYICDYFCYAHSIESVGHKHIIYENMLKKYFKEYKQEALSGIEKEELLKIWDKLREESISRIAPNYSLDANSHGKLILNQVKRMNDLYKKEYEVQRHDNWMESCEQIYKDICYSLFVCKKPLEWVLSPVECLRTN